jgi:hypothetical protein
LKKRKKKKRSYKKGVTQGKMSHPLDWHGGGRTTPHGDGSATPMAKEKKEEK